MTDPEKCPTCQNTGMVTCWHPVDVKFFSKHLRMPGQRSGGAVLFCPCKAGKRFEGGKLVRYNPAKHVLLHKGNAYNAKSEQNLRDWIENRSTSGVVGVEEWHA